MTFALTKRHQVVVMAPFHTRAVADDGDSEKNGRQSAAYKAYRLLDRQYTDNLQTVSHAYRLIIDVLQDV